MCVEDTREEIVENLMQGFMQEYEIEPREDEVSSISWDTSEEIRFCFRATGKCLATKDAEIHRLKE